MNLKHSIIATTLLILAGCSHEGGATSNSGQQSSTQPPSLRLTGPGGSVGLGDEVAVAMKAFPAPTGARVFDHSLSFSMATKEGWGWGAEDEKQSFEAATRNGKIVDLAWTRAAATDKPELALGEPTRKVIGKSVDAHVWESGDNARFWVHFKTQNAVLPIGDMILIGSKADLNLLNYRPDDPGTFVKQMDSMTEQRGNPTIKKEMEKAKKKALEQKPG